MRNRLLLILVMAALGMLQACKTSEALKDTDRGQLQKQIADMDRKIEDLNHKLSVLQYTVDSHQQSIQDMKSGDASKRVEPIPSAPPSPGASKGKKALPKPTDSPSKADGQPKTAASDLAESAEMIYNQALAVYMKKDYDEAATLFQEVADNYPGHDLSDNALYWVGECRYARKDFKGAIVAFNQVVTQYPAGSKVPDALLKTGYSYLALGDESSAQSFLKKVVRQYPFTPAGAKAGETLKRMQ